MRCLFTILLLVALLPSCVLFRKHKEVTHVTTDSVSHHQTEFVEYVHHDSAVTLKKVDSAATVDSARFCEETTTVEVMDTTGTIRQRTVTTKRTGSLQRHHRQWRWMDQGTTASQNDSVKASAGSDTKLSREVQTKSTSIQKQRNPLKTLGLGLIVLVFMLSLISLLIYDNPLYWLLLILRRFKKK